MLVEYEKTRIKAPNGYLAQAYRCKEIGLNHYALVSELMKKSGRSVDGVKASIRKGRPYWIPCTHVCIVDGDKPAPPSIRGEWVSRDYIAKMLEVGQKWVGEQVEDGCFLWKVPDRKRQKNARKQKAVQTKRRDCSELQPHVQKFLMLPVIGGDLTDQCGADVPAALTKAGLPGGELPRSAVGAPSPAHSGAARSYQSCRIDAARIP